ncbi:MAG: hypothetical protein KBS59_03180, partial [Clostridiales bacterium]|nr:hypothetical protein [Clostridiales bacterium]
STYNTISASSISYITGDNASKVGISQFPAHLCTIAVPTKVAETPKTGVAYKFSLEQVNRGETLFFTGRMSGNYLATSQSVSEAVNVFVEEVEGGYRFYFLDGETKNYVEIYEYTAGKAGVHITTEPTTVFTWNDEAKTFFAHVADDDRYLGTYSTYNTISASSISYITGDNASKVGISQFPAHLAIIGF